MAFFIELLKKATALLSVAFVFLSVLKFTEERMLANKGFKIFVIVWFGQLVSLTGTAVTRFALLIWAYEQTGSATTLALLGFYSFVPYILVSPIAGVWVDRLDRRRIMMVTDLGAGLMTLAILGLYATGSLEIWHLFVAEALTGFFEAFQVPAYTAVTTLLIPKNQYARASGMNSMAHSAAQIGGPVLAGLLLGFIHIEGVMIVDIATVIVALLTLLIVRFPTIKVDEAEQAQKTNTLQEI
ncbi:MAG: MFS transporter, partial [Chloroflexi bacterium]